MTPEDSRMRPFRPCFPLSRLPRLSLAGAALALLAGCSILPEPQADPVRYFTLTEPVAAAPAGAVQVRPVQLAGHLRNRALAVRVGEHEVIYLEHARWAEPLDEAVTQVLRARLGAETGEATITVQIQRCELVRSEANAVQVAATYEIRRVGGGPVRSGAFTSSARTWDGRNPADLVAQLRAALGELADAMARGVASGS